MELDAPNRPESRASAASSRSSSVRTPPNDNADIVVMGQLVKPRSFRRTASGLVDCFRVLTHTFGYAAYKGRQKEIVEAAVRGADVLVVAPTGMGKSLCFQIPAVADQFGVSIVVSPLLALMSNQVSALREKGVDVASLCSDTQHYEKSRIAKDLGSGHPRIRLLYITPEKLASAEFSKLMQKVYENKQVMRLVVDEAHCISEWGWDFRPEYRLLGNFRGKYPEVPIMALTASATAAVQDDIVSSLKMSSEHLLRVVHPFNRSNLFYEVKYVANPEPHLLMQDIVDYILKITERRGSAPCGIIYCRTREMCSLVAGYLRRKGISAKPYHRGVAPKALAETLQEWLDDKVEVVVATIAFGMGIDKPDVRYILHFDMPKSFEGYYQETGRAGRDGQASKCVLYYSKEDAFKVQRFVLQDQQKRLKGAKKATQAPAPSQRALQSLESLIRMAENIKTCRHVSICRYFGEKIDDKDPDALKSYCNNMCDVCKFPGKVKQRVRDLSSDEWVATQNSRLEEEADIAEPEEEEPVFIKQEKVSQPNGAANNRKGEWSTRLIDDVEEDSEEDGETASNGSGGLREIVPYQSKLPTFPKIFKPPMAGRPPTVTSPPPAPMEAVPSRPTKTLPAPASRPAPQPVVVAGPSTVQKPTSPVTPRVRQFRPGGRCLSTAALPSVPSADAGPANPNRLMPGAKRPLADLELNASQETSKRPRTDDIPSATTVTKPMSKPLVRQVSRPAFKTPFAKPPIKENEPLPAPPTSPSSATVDLAGTHSPDPMSEDTIAAPAPVGMNKGKGMAVDGPRQDKGKGRATEHAAIRPIAQTTTWRANAPTNEPFRNATDLMVFNGKVEANFSTKVPHQARDGAATAILKVLGQVMLQFSGRDELWERVGLPDAEREERRNILQQCARDVEFDMFSLVATLEGYRASLSSREEGIRMMRDASSPAWRDGPERDPVTVEARCVVGTLRNICKRRQKPDHLLA